MLILEGGQSTLNLERIRKDFGRITSANLPMLIWGGSIDTQLGKDLLRLWKDHLCQSVNADPWGGQLTLNLERIRKDLGRITSANMPMLILGGGSIDTQLGKDPQRLWKDCLCQSANADPGEVGRSTLNLERIRKDFGSITSANLPMLILGGG